MGLQVTQDQALSSDLGFWKGGWLCLVLRFRS